MICLGIESTAHTFGVGIIDHKKNILANVKDMYVTEIGGINPTDAKMHHIAVADAVIQKGLDEAKLSLDDIDVFSFSMGPGLPPCLVVGMNKCKGLARKTSKPLIGVNHCIAHLEIGRALTDAKDPVLLYASGANTQIIAYESGKFRIFGETLDQGCGNMIDAFGRHLGIGFPGGPKIQELASLGKNYIELPYAVKGMDISFTGILTNVKQKYTSGKYSKEDLCYSLQETIFAMLLEVSERALAHCQKDELVLGGGVACNTRLQEMSNMMCKEGGYRCYIPPRSVLVDNGLMIAWQGLIEHQAGTRMNIDHIDIMPNWRTDQVDVNWR